MDPMLRKHSVDVDDNASVADVKLLLLNMSLVPAGSVSKLEYQQRMLGDDECIDSIGYSPECSISLVCVSSTTASAAAGPGRHSPRPIESDQSAAARPAPASATAATTAVANKSEARSVIFFMGFDEALVQRALTRTGGDESAAIEILISGHLHFDESPSLPSSSDAASPPVIFPTGFDDALVRRALASAGGDEQRAAELLLSGRVPSSEQSCSSASSSAPAAAATAAAPIANSILCAKGHTCVLWTYTEQHICYLKEDSKQSVTCLKNIHVGDQGYRCSTCDYDVCVSCCRIVPSSEQSCSSTSSSAPAAAAAAAAPVINFATEWVCERGLIWPKAVDYQLHCPKRHTLTACALLLLCHVCGDDACSGGGKTCAAGCTYSVCAACLMLLQRPRAPAAAHAGRGGFPSLGVTPAFLQAFQSKWRHVIRGWTTEQVCQQLIKALTSRSGGSMCDVLMAAGSGLVGEANLFLSHTWGDVFLDTVDAALGAAEQAAQRGHVFIWFDVFSTSQHSALDIPSSQWMQLFQEAIEKMGSVAMVLQPWHDPLALKRAW